VAVTPPESPCISCSAAVGVDSQGRAMGAVGAGKRGMGGGVKQEI
jgi:hypothetical protein